jgi:predicted DNA-binding transcriptional regulator AlpA
MEDWVPRQNKTAQMSVSEVRALPVMIPVVEAGRAFGLTRDGVYHLLKHGEFPCRTVQVGRAKKVPRAELLRVLGMAEEIEPGVKAG